MLNKRVQTEEGRLYALKQMCAFKLAQQQYGLDLVPDVDRFNVMEKDGSWVVLIEFGNGTYIFPVYGM